MSEGALDPLLDAGREALASPEVRAAVENVTGAALELVKTVVISELPLGPLRPFAAPILSALGNEGITEVKHLEDRFLAGLAPVKTVVQVGTVRLALTVAREPELDRGDTTAEGEVWGNKE